jgi:hypothetical protein
MNGMTRLIPGTRRTEYMSNEHVRSAGDENATLLPTIINDGSQML